MVNVTDGADVDVRLRFLVVSLAFYGMSTFEGPMMAIKTVNALSHYTDWTIGHVHAGALGWVAMLIRAARCNWPRSRWRDGVTSSDSFTATPSLWCSRAIAR